MRYKFTEIAPSNKRQYVFAVGKKDIEILMGLVANACAHKPMLPRTPENEGYLEVYNRIRSMRRDFNKAYEEAKKLGDDGNRRKLL
jgi:hypothetical protein